MNDNRLNGRYDCLAWIIGLSISVFSMAFLATECAVNGEWLSAILSAFFGIIAANALFFETVKYHQMDNKK